MNKSHQQGSDHTNPWIFAMELGFFAGMIWGRGALDDVYAAFYEGHSRFFGGAFL